MIDWHKITGFQWDSGNLHKSYLKHQISPNQAEEIFLDPKLITYHDLKHSQSEDRFIAIGQTLKGTTLYSVFTLRNTKIRIISTRKANQKEQKAYDQTT